MRSAFRFTTSRGGENSTGTMGIFASALTHSRRMKKKRLPLLSDLRRTIKGRPFLE
jgi:hypothetical protein